ncbi:MAG: PqqD family protein [Gaiellaceae bacterium]
MASPEPVAPAELTFDELAVAKVRVPAYVVYREFAHETVMLNLRTGKYHGLSPSGGVILDALDKAPTVATAVGEIAKRYGAPVEEIEQDVYEFCADMLQRSLIELHDAAG